MTTKYWVAAGTSNLWNATTTSHWSLTSGGTPGETLNAGDDVVFDANSGTGTSTMSVGISLNSFDASASSAVTLTTNASQTMTITGTVCKFGGSMIYAPGGDVALAAASGTVEITCGGKSFRGLRIGSTGASTATFQLQDNLSVNTNTRWATLYIDSGTFDANGFDVLVANVNASNSNTRTILMGNGDWTVTGDDFSHACFDFNTVTNLTVTKGTGTLRFTSPSTGTEITLNFGSGKDWGNVSFEMTAYTGAIIKGSPTFDDVNFGAGLYGQLQGPGTMTVNGDITDTGTGANEGWVSLESYNPLTSTYAISKASGTVTLNYAVLRGLSFTGGATFTAQNSIDRGGASGITITPPSGGGGGGYGGGLIVGPGAVM